MSDLVIDAENAIVPSHHAVAVNATEMAMASAGIKTFLRNKLNAIQAEIDEAQAAHDAAVKHKWKASTFVNILRRQKSQHLYYGKLLAACEAGYTIVPNMDVDVFAIRVKREYPIAKDAIATSSGSWRPSASLEEEQEQRLPVGDGRYESPQQMATTDHDTTVDSRGQTLQRTIVRAVDFADLEFPLAVAHPQVMDATAAAMALKIFDRIGIVPRSQRRGDPIVLGQITRKEGYGTRTASFLIAWYLDVRTL